MTIKFCNIYRHIRQFNIFADSFQYRYNKCDNRDIFALQYSHTKILILPIPTYVRIHTYICVYCTHIRSYI